MMFRLPTLSTVFLLLLGFWIIHNESAVGAFSVKPSRGLASGSLSSQNSIGRWQRRDQIDPPLTTTTSIPRSFSLSSKKSSDDDDSLSASEATTPNAFIDQITQIIAPAQEVLDGATGGWALTCADLSPETEDTVIGQAFLATNLAYALVGILLAIQGDLFLGGLTEMCSIASFAYHYTQLQGNRAADGALRLVLFMDYVFAFSTIFVAGVYILIDQQLPATDCLLSTGFGLGFLFACWKWEEGLTYIVLHSLWHLCSAYTGYLVGTAHLTGVA